MQWDYFTAEELKCNCGECDGEMNHEFMTKLVAIRKKLGFPFVITSAFRCRLHNAKVGGSKNSYHLLGRAVDIAVTHDQAVQIIEQARAFGFRGIGVSQKGGGRFIHIDDRTQNTMTLFSY